MKKINKMLMVLGVILISTTLASAALLQYFGKVTTTMNVQQSIVVGTRTEAPVGYDIDWHNYDEPITRDIGDVIHCTDYCYKLWIRNQACKPATVTLTDVCTEAPASIPVIGGWNDTGITKHHYVLGDTQTIELRFKDAQWNVINEENMGADIIFNTCGQTFSYVLNYWGLQGDYSLVYYIDQDPRFDVWGKVVVLDSFEFTGNNVETGSLDIPTMPYVDDYNAGETGQYLTYDHTSGAKLWLVPTENIENGQLVAWTPDYYLFETDLALYVDCDEVTPICIPYVYTEFNTNILKAESTYCWISCYHVAFDIMPGLYEFETTVNAAEILPQL